MPDEPCIRIAIEHFGLTHVRPVRVIQCFSRHYVLATHRSCFVLSRVDRGTGRIPFRLQFDVLDILRESGLDVVRRPVPTTNGAAYVERPEHYWFLRRYRSTDDVVFWQNRREMVNQAATALARIHRAGADEGARLARITRFDHRGLAPFYRNVADFLDDLDPIYDAFDAGSLSDDDLDLLKRTLDFLRADRDMVLGECRQRGLIGITHHDYRPDNILVKNGRIAEIVDWDCAFVDHQLYDVAYAAFQFGPRQRLRDTTLLNVELFIETYLAARGMPDVSKRAIAWFLRFAVVKRLLINGSNAERMRLLHELETRRPVPDPPATILLPTGEIARTMAL